MIAPELSRIVTLDRLPTRVMVIEATEEERRRLAGRFGLSALNRLRATLTLTLTGEGDIIDAHGKLAAAYEQTCAVSGDPLPVVLNEQLTLRFVPALSAIEEDEEHEFVPDAPDEIEYAGAAIDLGEAVAQSLGLAIDPYATGPDASRTRQETGLDQSAAASGPFAALAALKDQA